MGHRKGRPSGIGEEHKRYKCSTIIRLRGPEKKLRRLSPSRIGTAGNGQRRCRGRAPRLAVALQHTILCLFDFSANFARQLAVRLDFARFQRAPEGSKQSTRDRCNQIRKGSS